MEHTLVDVARRWAKERGDRPAFLFLADGEAESEELSHGGLYHAARRLAAALLARGIGGPQDSQRVLLLFPPGLDFLVAFLACLRAGVIAVPAYPPHARRGSTRLARIASDCRPALALTSVAARRRAAAALEPIGIPCLSTDRLLEEAGEEDPSVWLSACPGPTPEDAAFLQYTSGSTAAPRGVIVSHGALLHNQRAIAEGFGHDSETVVVSWLPLYHDMGLIGAVLQPLFLGSRCVLMAPTAFLKRPRRWLEAIHRYRAATSGGPNFAYELCVDRIPVEDREGLDLSCWEVAFNGAEPVRAVTLERFTEAFALSGFRASAFYPCYGLAEATLLVSGGTRGEEPRVVDLDRSALEEGRVERVRFPEDRGSGRALVSCGRARGGMEVCLVDPESRRPAAPGEIAEVWLRGPSVCSGYWEDTEATREIFQAGLLEEDGGEPGQPGDYLRTGDLGFVDGDELFLAGRLKDLIILRGRNVYPQDVEAAVEGCHPAVRTGGAAAIAWEAEGEERLVVVAEVERGVRRDPSQGATILERTRQALSDSLDVAAFGVVLVPPGGVPHTTSGKVRRRECRRRLAKGELTVVYQWWFALVDAAQGASPVVALAPVPRPGDPVEKVEAWLLGRLALRLGLPSGKALDPDLPAVAYGLDSLAAIELEHQVEETLAVRLPMATVLEAPTLRALAEALHQCLETPPDPTETLPRGAPDGDHPVTDGQRALYYLHQLRPDSPAYNLVLAVEVTGDVGEEDLERAAAALVRRHAALRTTFHAPSGRPLQRVAPEEAMAGEGWRLHCDFVVHSGYTDSTARLDPDALAATMVTVGEAPFALEQGPLWRFHAWPRGPEGGASRWALLLALHHMVGDLWSWTVLMNHLMEELKSPGELPPGASEVRFSDYARWQDRRLAGPFGERLWGYWKEVLPEAPPELELPTDHPRPPVQTYRGAVRLRRLSAGLGRALVAVGRREDATLFMVLLAGFQALLGRYTGQDRFLLGTLSSGRDRRAYRDLVGFLVNTLVLATHLEEELPFLEYLRRVRKGVVGAFAHEDWPFSRLVEALKPVRDPSRSPLFQVLFSLQTAPVADPRSARLLLGAAGGEVQRDGLVLRMLDLPRRIAQFDLSVLAAPASDGGVLLALEYNADLFDATTAERLGRYLEVLLQGVVSAPATPLGRLPLLSVAQQHQLLLEVNDTASKLPAEASVLSWIEAWMSRAPNAVALRFGDRSLSYRQLDLATRALARQLRREVGQRGELGTAWDVRIGVAMQRNPALPVALLGVLRAGAAYVPVPPQHPEERRTAVAADAGVLLCLEAPGAPVPVAGIRSLVVDPEALVREGETLAGLPALTIPDPRTPAYVIYTSGSTGKPKGVVNRHRSLANRLRWMQRRYRLGPGDRVLQKTPYTFDVSVWEFFWPWMTGATLVVAPPGVHRDAQHLIRLICEAEITVVHFVPPMMRLWLEEPEVAECGASLRWVLASGESLPLGLVERFFQRLPEVALENLYGPTEAAIDVTYHPCRPGDREVPIGRPIENVRIHVLDRRGRPAPIGVPGELCIGGTNLAQGYQGAPRRTAVAFVPNPFAARERYGGARLYRTGDRVRRRGDGALLFLGRLDHQVKLRGFRLEPGEVESVLARHPAIREAAVLVARTPVSSLADGARADSGDPGAGDPAVPVRRFAAGAGSGPSSAPAEGEEGGVPRLVAYFTTGGGSQVPPGSELRRFLARSLPEYMIPAFFVPLESMPLSRNGKLDRGRLPAPGRYRPRLDVALALPQGEEEELLAEIWSQVLQVDQIGVDDNFFELGGDSIRSIQIRSRMAAQGRAVTLDQLLRFQTIRELAQLLKQSPGVGAGEERAADPFSLLTGEDRRRLQVAAVGVEDAYPLSRTQAGVLFHAQYDPNSPLYRNIFLCRVEGPLELDPLQQAVQATVERHPILRTGFDLAQFAEPLQLVWRGDRGPGGSPIAVPVEQQEADSEEAVAAWINQEKGRPFAWDRPPLVRFTALRRGPKIFYLALSYVDALLDGWSTASLLGELLHRYDRNLTGTGATPEELANVAFRDFVAAERRAMEDQESRSFWQNELRGAKPTGLSRWSVSAGGVVREGITLLDLPVPRSLVTALEGVARQARVALKHALLAAHLRVLALFSGRDEVLTGIESNGRLERAGGDLSLGMHVNVLPFRCRLEDTGRERWLDLLRRVFESERRMLPYRRFPLFEIQKQHGEDLTPVVFNFTHFHVLQRLEGLRALRILDAKGFDQTNFLLRADFNRNPFTDQLQLSLTGRAADLDSTELRRLAQAYGQVLRRMVADPTTGYLETGWLKAAERHQLSVEWNDTSVPFITVRALHAAFEAQAARRADAPALEHRGATWTFGRLEEAANRLAHHLRRLGVGPEVPVALCLPRGPYLVASVLGVLKAGGAYVPLDPNHPGDRLAHLLQDSASAVLLTERRYLTRFPDTDTVAVCLDEAREALLARPGTPPTPRGHPANTAYILYTSGSTGRPKGVEVSHGAALNLIAAMLRRLRFRREDRMLSLTTLGFDISVLELFLPLSCGARIVITPEETASEGLELAQLIHRSGVNFIQATPATYRFLVEVGWSGDADLTVLCGGEALSEDLVRALSTRCRSLWNLYGPTETTVWSSAERILPLPRGKGAAAAVNIGRGVANTQLYVLDSRGRQTLPGVPGELYIGGRGVARGYRHRPGLTAARFVPHPYSRDVQGARLYRTGDLVRYRRDGKLDFLGRADDQLKIQGHRIEPSEVEAALEQHPEVVQAVVVARELQAGHRQLVAYLRCETAGQEPGGAELRDMLRQRLPGYMIPSVLVSVQRFPLNASGKVDRGRLPAPGRTGRTVAELQRFLERLQELTEEEARGFLSRRFRE